MPHRLKALVHGGQLFYELPGTLLGPEKLLLTHRLQRPLQLLGEFKETRYVGDTTLANATLELATIAEQLLRFPAKILPHRSGYAPCCT